MHTIRWYKKHQRLPEPGTPVQIKVKIATEKECAGYFVHPRHLQARKPGEQGTYKGYVPGAGGDVWWIEHGDGSVAAYCFDEVIDPRN